MTGTHMFTLGTDHHAGPLGAYVWVTGCDAEEARGIMFALHGPNWAFQYSGPDMWRYLQRHPRSYPTRIITVTDMNGSTPA